MIADCQLHVDVGAQQLKVLQKDKLFRTYSIATSKYGLGEIPGSFCTPRGWHQIRAKIGAHLPMQTVFVARRPTGELYNPDLAMQHPERDWILSRILWLSGLEVGKNRLGKVDTMQRYIYIHGCPDEIIFGEPSSHGCVRMHNNDIVELFDLVDTGTKVHIG